MPSLVEIVPVILEKKNFKCRIHLPLEKGMSLHFKKHKSPSTKNVVDITRMVLENIF